MRQKVRVEGAVLVGRSRKDTTSYCMFDLKCLDSHHMFSVFLLLFYAI
jgi:hypothetical protein